MRPKTPNGQEMTYNESQFDYLFEALGLTLIGCLRSFRELEQGGGEGPADRLRAKALIDDSIETAGGQVTQLLRYLSEIKNKVNRSQRARRLTDLQLCLDGMKRARCRLDSECNARPPTPDEVEIRLEAALGRCPMQAAEGRWTGSEDMLEARICALSSSIEAIEAATKRVARDNETLAHVTEEGTERIEQLDQDVTSLRLKLVRVRKLMTKSRTIIYVVLMTLVLVLTTVLSLQVKAKLLGGDSSVHPAEDQLETEDG